MTIALTAALWIRIPVPHRCPRIRLICLPHAGAGASTFYPWRQQLESAGVELRAVQYPGHEDRVAEPLISSWEQMVRALADLWADLAGGTPCAVFGHSMGALIGFELARELVERGEANLPCRLFVSGRNPPHLPRRLPSFQNLPDDEFIATLRKEQVLQLPNPVLENLEMMALLTPILRADCRISDTGPLTSSMLDLPLSVFGGHADPWTSFAELAEWQRYCTQPCRLRMISGDHLFHQSARRQVTEGIVADLAAH